MAPRGSTLGCVAQRGPALASACRLRGAEGLLTGPRGAEGLWWGHPRRSRAYSPPSLASPLGRLGGAHPGLGPDYCAEGHLRYPHAPTLCSFPPFLFIPPPLGRLFPIGQTPRTPCSPDNISHVLPHCADSGVRILDWGLSSASLDHVFATICAQHDEEVAAAAAHAQAGVAERG